MRSLVSKGKRLTVGEKIQIHLLDFTRYRGELQTPIDITQDGIAKNLGIIRSAVPRAVGSLIDKDLVEEQLAHIDGLSRRRKVYMLTDKGIIESRELLDEVGRISVKIKGEDETKRIFELMDEGKVTLKNISQVIKSGIYDRSKPKIEKKKKGKITYTHSLSPPDMFIGRESEIEEIKEGIKSKKRRITVVYGIAGVGKTTLAWKVSNDLSDMMNIFYIDLKEWTTLGYMLKELSEFLSETGWEQLKSYLESDPNLDIENVADLLREIPDKIPLLLIIDDIHRASDDIVMLLKALKQRIPSMGNINMLCLSRVRADFYDIRDVRITGLVGEIELLGFDRKTSRKFLEERGFQSDEVDEIIERTGGHPLALVLVEKEGVGIDVSDFDNFLSEEIFSKLTEREAYLLGLLSLSRLQLDEEDLREVDEMTSDTLAKLCDSRLVFDTPGGFVIHDLVREQAVENLKTKQKDQANRELASIFKDKLFGMGFFQEIRDDVPPFPFSREEELGMGPVPLYISENIYHLIGGGLYDEGRDLLLRACLLVPSEDLISEYGNILCPHRSEISGIRDLGVTVIVNISRENMKNALSMAKKSDDMKAKNDLSKAVKLALKLWIPWLEEKVNGPEKAMKALEDLDNKLIPEKLSYYFRVYKASLLYKLGDHKGAAEAYKDFLTSIMENEDLPLKLKNVTSEALETAESGEIHKSTDNFQKIMELTRANRDALSEEMPYVDVDHHLLSAIYSVYYGRSVK